MAALLTPAARARRIAKAQRLLAEASTILNDMATAEIEEMWSMGHARKEQVRTLATAATAAEKADKAARDL